MKSQLQTVTTASLALVAISFALVTATQRQDTSTTAVGDYLYYDSLNGEPYNVSYDNRSFIINGQRTLLLGGSVHYPRLSVGQWGDILTKARNDGLNHIETYVFWNLHEPVYNFDNNRMYDFSGRANITHFLSLCSQHGLFVNLRIGPFIGAEWNFGGLPSWLLHIDNIIFRANNSAWKSEMSTWVSYISSVIEPYLAKNGGPIILAQIENEYRWDDEAYISFCGELAASQGLDVPWIMCNGYSASNTIETCNGNDCYQSFIPSFATNHPGQPLGWTENEGWFQAWQPGTGKNYDPEKVGYANRSPEDVANAVALWFAAGGSHQNYYMYYGGNHVKFGASSGITNYYADGVNIHSDGLYHEPKRSHLMKLHQILAQNQKYLLMDGWQYENKVLIDNKTTTFAYVCGDGALVFLVNQDDVARELTWEGVSYYLPNVSVSILDAQGSELYNSGKVDASGLATERVYETLYSVAGGELTFEYWSESVPVSQGVAEQNRSAGYVFAQTPQEQIRLSNNTSEYLYYETSVSTNFSKYSGANGVELVFDGRAANAYGVWLDSVFVGSAWNGQHAANATKYHIKLASSVRQFDCSQTECVLTVMSSNLGIENGRLHGNTSVMDMKGLTGSVMAYDATQQSVIEDYTNNGWKHWIGSNGEYFHVTTSASIKWKAGAANETNLTAMTWFKTTFKTPDFDGKYYKIGPDGQLSGVTGSLLLDIGANGKGMQRGHWWLNGEDMGHYNNAIQDESKVMAQQYYYIPLDGLKNDALNTLIFQEEMPMTQEYNASFSNIQVVFSTFVIPQDK